MSCLSQKGDIVTKKEIIVLTIAKGVAHATVVPFMVFVLVNLFIKGNYGGMAALGYVLFAGTLYNVIFKDKDLSKMAFNRTVGLISIIVLLVYGGWFLLYTILS